jgi:copper(I)-binding protein
MTYRTSLLALMLAVGLAVPTIVLAHDTATPAAGHEMAHQMAHEVVVGNLAISGGFSRATLPNAPVGGGFLTITNNGAAEDRLISATSPAAGDVQLHEMAMEGDVMKMRELPEGIPVPAGETVTLQPGGLHLMLMQLTGPLVEGTSFPVTLTFEKAGAVTVDLNVLSSGAKTDESMHGEMHGDAAHGAMAPVDQSGLSDVDAITAMQKAMFDTPESPLTMGPIVVSGEYAVSDWAQDKMGGRALLRKTGKGWAIHLCSGSDLKDAAALVTIGVPADAAKSLTEALASAEASLPGETIALYDSFDGTMMVDESLI